MADSEDIQPLVCDNGTGMVKVVLSYKLTYLSTVNVEIAVNSVFI